MAIPTHYIRKRDTLHSEKSTPAQLTKIAREFLAMERFSDALDFFEKARDTAGIREVKEIALQRGDTFLLSRLDRFDRTLVSQDEWKRAAEKAEAGGRASMALFVAKKFAPPPVAATAAAVKTGGVLPGEAPLSEV